CGSHKLGEACTAPVGTTRCPGRDRRSRMALAGPDSLPSGVEAVLRASNPWWDGQPGRPVPPFRRWPFEMILRRLTDKTRLPAIVLRGPRQVGKTTLQEQIIEKLIISEVS